MVLKQNGKIRTEEQRIIKQRFIKVFKVLDKLPVGDIYCVCVEGDIGSLKNGLKLTDEKGNIFDLQTVGMTHFRNVEDCLRYAHIVLGGDVENIGETLYLV